MVTRRSAATIAGARESIAIAATLGGEVRRARRTRRLPMRAVAAQVGISVTRLSEIERGLGARAPLETWVALGVALGRPVAVSLSRPLGQAHHEVADAGHLEIQEHVLRLARANGIRAAFELPPRPLAPSRSTDVGLHDRARRVRLHVECWNTFGDLGAAVRATARKHAEAAATWPDDRIATVWVVRDTAANRALLARFPAIIEATFTGSSRQWVRALTSGAEAPEGSGLVWSDPRAGAGTIREHRRARMQP
jgi:transcriptional regulator with XRE-family HTH domain